MASIIEVDAEQTVKLLEQLRDSSYAPDAEDRLHIEEIIETVQETALPEDIIGQIQL